MVRHISSTTCSHHNHHNINNNSVAILAQDCQRTIEKCIQVLMVRSVKRRGAPAPVVELLPVPAVIQAPTPVVEYLAPSPAVVQAPTPVVEYLAPVPAVFQAPTPVAKSLAQCHAPAFPLSPDASDMSAPQDMYTSSWVSLPVPIKTCTKVRAEVGARRARHRL